MGAPELWDAVDCAGTPLGFDLVRGEPIPDGVFHRVVFVFTCTDRGNILLTRRHPSKTYPLAWEVTAGSVLKGESPEQGALRELREETGLCPGTLRLFFTKTWDGVPAVCCHYLAAVPEDGLTVTLQQGETVEWALVSYGQFKDMVHRGELPTLSGARRGRFPDYEALLDAEISALSGASPL